MKSQERIVAQHLLQIKAIKLNPQNPFTWASGRRSPIYCDNRIVLSFPVVRSIVQNQLVLASKEFNSIDGIAGVATAGIAHGALLADRLNLPFIYIRDKAKGHGRQNQIEGMLEEGKSYLVIEDLISTGGSSLKAIDVLRKAGGKASGLLALFTYGFQEASDAFAAADCKWKSLSQYDALLAEAVDANYITANDQQLLSSWRNNPIAWSEQYNKNKNVL